MIDTPLERRHQLQSTCFCGAPAVFAIPQTSYTYCHQHALITAYHYRRWQRWGWRSRYAFTTVNG